MTTLTCNGYPHLWEYLNENQAMRYCSQCCVLEICTNEGRWDVVSTPTLRVAQQPETTSERQPAKPARDTCCGKDIVSEGGICTDCPYAPPQFQSEYYSPSVWRELAGNDIAAQPVSPSLKQRFGDWIDARTAQGIETYGGPLTTDNGRDAERDMLEELLDFCQYQEQSRLELIAENARLRQRIGVARERLGLPALEGYKP